MHGEVVYLYAFDVADEIATGRIQQILANQPYPFEIKTDHTIPKDIPLYRPLAIEPPQPEATCAGQPVRLLVRVYEVGVVSITMRVAFQVDRLADLVSYHKPVLSDGRTFDQVARELCEQVCDSLHDVMVRTTLSSVPEAYTAFCLTQLDGCDDVNAWLDANRREVAGLLTETDPNVLSESQVVEVARISRSFAVSDGVVIDWDAALVVDLTGYVDDVLYVLELANLQLEEYRVMDQRLDAYLDRAYGDVTKRRFGLFWAYTGVLSTLRKFRVDVTKLNDEVTHISKLFGDWHLARVYLGASERFYLDHWRKSVENRLSQLDELYSVVNSDISNQRMMWLEIIVVIFFAIDLWAILFFGK